jgi:hypothetical protein
MEGVIGMAPPFDTAAIPIIDRRLLSERELDDYRRFRFRVSPISRPGMAARNPAPPPTYEHVVKQSQDEQATKAKPAARLRDAFRVT